MVKATVDFDYEITRGDTAVIIINALDRNKQPIDMTIFNLRFSMYDSFEDLDEIVQKTRIGGTPAGIYTYLDTVGQAYGLTASNQIAIRLEAVDTEDLRLDIFPFDVETSNVADKHTPIHGNIILKKNKTL